MPKPLVSVRQRRTAFFRACSFVDLAISQGGALRNLWEQFNANLDEVRADPEQMVRLAFESLVVRKYAQEYVLILALHQACEWVQEVARHDPTLKPQVKAFRRRSGRSTPA